MGWSRKCLELALLRMTNGWWWSFRCVRNVRDCGNRFIYNVKVWVPTLLTDFSRSCRLRYATIVNRTPMLLWPLVVRTGLLSSSRLLYLNMEVMAHTIMAATTTTTIISTKTVPLLVFLPFLALLPHPHLLPQEGGKGVEVGRKLGERTRFLRLWNKGLCLFWGPIKTGYHDPLRLHPSRGVVSRMPLPRVHIVSRDIPILQRNWVSGQLWAFFRMISSRIPIPSICNMVPRSPRVFGREPLLKSNPVRIKISMPLQRLVWPRIVEPALRFEPGPLDPCVPTWMSSTPRILTGIKRNWTNQCMGKKIPTWNEPCRSWLTRSPRKEVGNIDLELNYGGKLEWTKLRSNSCQDQNPDRGPATPTWSNLLSREPSPFGPERKGFGCHCAFRLVFSHRLSVVVGSNPCRRCLHSLNEWLPKTRQRTLWGPLRGWL